ncbi:MAG: Lrp/AsnC family transcriptional regulator, partial [Pseudomonadota bacterium]|nr:Lrp/AsnC family transcriptional regulator [Pseudomonadota bacterium]
ATLPLADISKRVGLSVTPCWNRIRKMEENGIIVGRQTLIDRSKVNLPIVVFLSLTVSGHTENWVEKFVKTIESYDEIVEVHRLTGASADYVLKIVAESVKDYDDFQQQLIQQLDFTKMSSSISLQELKQTSSVPLNKI